MKRLVATALFTAAFAVSALAQDTPASPETPAAEPAAPAIPVGPSNCPPTPEPPTLPDGATADAAAMQAGQDAYNDWADKFRAGADCRRSEVQTLRATYDTRVSEFNALAATFNDVGKQWIASGEAWTARQEAERENRGRRRR